MNQRQRQPTALQWIALSLWAAVGCCSVVLFTRAAGGHFVSPLPSGLVIVVTFTTVSLSLLSWEIFHHGHRQGSNGRRLADGLLSLSLPAMFVYSVCAASGPLTLAGVTTLLVSSAAGLATRECLRAQVASGSQSTALEQNRLDEQMVIQGQQESTCESTPQELTSLDGGTSLIRRSADDGTQEIETIQTAEFNQSQQRTAIHIPINPMLRSLPIVEVEPLDESEITIRVTDVHRYGVRIEVKRSGVLDSEQRIPVGVMIRETSERRSAA